MTNVGHIVYFPGFEYKNTSKGWFMHQRRYALEIVNKFEIEHCNPAITTAKPSLQLSKEEDVKRINLTQYRKFIGPPRYLCNTRPDLAYSVRIVSRFMENPKVSHLAATKSILRYTK